MNVRNPPIELHDTDEIVERLYDVALDPLSYEALLDTWEDRMASAHPVRRREVSQQLDTHLDRAGLFLDRMDTSAAADPVATLVHTYARHTVLVLDRDLRLEQAHLGDGATSPPRGSPLERCGVLSREAAAQVKDSARALLASGGERLLTLPEDDALEAGVQLARLSALGDKPHGVAVVLSRLRWDSHAEAGLIQTFGLTVTEADIVRQMLMRRDRAEIARRRERSVETVKRQVASIFQKTGCKSSTELIITVMSFLSLAADGPALATLAEDPLVCVPLPARNGRASRVHLRRAGDPNGQPIVHLPGPFCLSQWPQGAEQAARDAGLCILTPIRSGYGPEALPLSDLDPASRVADEILAVMDHEGVAQAPFVTQSNDILFAARFARKYPDRISALVACAGAPPLTDPAQYRRMDKWHRFVLANARYAPRLLPFVVKSGFQLARRGGKETFLQSVYANVPGDLEAFRDPQVHRALMEGSRYALSEAYVAHAAFAEVISAYARPDWGGDFAFAEANIPVHMVNGTADPMAPPDTLREVCDAHPKVTLHLFPDCGEFVFFRHWAPVLDLLKTLVPNG